MMCRISIIWFLVRYEKKRYYIRPHKYAIEVRSENPSPGSPPAVLSIVLIYFQNPVDDRPATASPPLSSEASVELSRPLL